MNDAKLRTYSDIRDRLIVITDRAAWGCCSPVRYDWAVEHLWLPWLFFTNFARQPRNRPTPM